jgi:osomolarity two-component system, sensor histidine kinase CHK1
MGYTADHAKDGVEVLELCERAALADSMYDVILLDIQMPRMDVSPLYCQLRLGIRGIENLATAIRR